MENVRCPFCHCLVNVNDVDNEDGSCPECGAPLMGSSIFAPDEGDGSDDYLDDEGRVPGSYEDL